VPYVRNQVWPVEQHPILLANCKFTARHSYTRGNCWLDIWALPPASLFDAGGSQGISLAIFQWYRPAAGYK